MKTINQTLTVLSVATMMTFSAACSKSVQREKILPANGSPAAKAASVDGTTDGGGGNAIDNRMLESYIIKAEEQTATKRHLADKIKTLFGSDKDPNGNALFRFKTWYLVPTSLKNISKKALGIEFTEDQTQQVAIQTKDEIWIDANLFKNMSSEEQAKLILHESMMTFYMTKFMTLKELCDRNEKAGFDSCNMSPAAYKAIENSFKPEQERPLQSHDYNAIRTMTNWLWEAKPDFSKNEFHRIAKAAGFDKRFKYEEVDSEQSEIKISDKKFTLLLEAARHGQYLPKQCVGVNSKKTFACEVSWSIEKSPQFGTNIRVAVRDMATKSIIVDSTFTVYNEVHASGYTSAEGDPKNIVMTSSNLFGQYDVKSGHIPAEPGTRGSFANFIVDSKAESLKGLLLVPLVNAGSYEETRETVGQDGKKQKDICTITQIVKRIGETVQEEALLIGNPEELMNQAVLFENMNFGSSSNCKKIQE